LSKREFVIETGEGPARAAIYRPESGATGGLPGVLFYMDAFGPRPALDQMAQRIADQGYVVLLPDLLYRYGAYGPYEVGAVMADEGTRAEVFGRVRATTLDMTAEDSRAFVPALEAEIGSASIASVGYCMGGPRALRAAADFPDRIRAAASFHGGNLATDAADSPHLLAPEIKARLYVGCASTDNSFPPEQSTRLSDALRKAEVDFALENYLGCAHGWTVPDLPSFNAQGAERYFSRFTTLLAETLH